MRDRRRWKYTLLLTAVLPLIGCTTDEPDPSGTAEESSDSAAGETHTPPGSGTGAATGEFQPLSLIDFLPFSPDEGAAESWLQADGVLRTTGQPRGYLISDDEFSNFTLELEYRMDPPQSDEELPNLNTGVLLYVVGENRLWPVCLEVQGKYVEMAQIKSNARDLAVEAQTDLPLRDEARTPPGEWNRLEIVSRDGALTVQLNGTEVSRSQPAVRNGETLTSGRLGLQAEGWPVEFRSVRIRRD
jgi:hypothetical protein